MSKRRRKITLQTLGQRSPIHLSVWGAYLMQPLISAHPLGILAQAFGSNTWGKLQQDSITIPAEDYIYMARWHFSK